MNNGGSYPPFILKRINIMKTKKWIKCTNCAIHFIAAEGSKETLCPDCQSSDKIRLRNRHKKAIKKGLLR